MRDFFKPWRRKIGVVTLLMACAFAAGWVRSTAVADRLYHGPFVRWLPFTSIDSANSEITWQGDDNWFLSNWSVWTSCSLEEYGRADSEYTIYQRAVWLRRSFCGFVAGGWGILNDENEFDYSTSLISVPYWSIVLPLTLLSAYLLLSKPRVATPMKTNESIPPEAP